MTFHEIDLQNSNIRVKNFYYSYHTLVSNNNYQQKYLQTNVPSTRLESQIREQVGKLNPKIERCKWLSGMICINHIIHSKQVVHLLKRKLSLFIDLLCSKTCKTDKDDVFIS